MNLMNATSLRYTSSNEIWSITGTVWGFNLFIYSGYLAYIHLQMLIL